MLSVSSSAPLLWENDPIDDAGVAAELHIGPYLHRDPELALICSGICASPMNQAHAPKLPLATLGAYLQGPLRAIAQL